jgi:hypothetical protein
MAPNYQLCSSQEVEIHLLTADYLIMTETYTWTFELFIGALGSALGIWLGLDFVVLIYFLFKPTMMLIRKFLSNDGESILLRFLGRALFRTRGAARIGLKDRKIYSLHNNTFSASALGPAGGDILKILDASIIKMA